MKKGKRILALLGVIVLLLICMSPLVTGLMKGPNATGLFMSSLFCIIVIPVFLYMYMMIYKYLKNRNQAPLQKQQEADEIENIIFDVGNVLVDFAWEDLFVNKFQFTRETCEELTQAMFLNPLWNEFDRGVVSDNEILESFYAQVPHLKKEVTLVFENLAETIKKRPYTETLLKTLKKKGYRLFVLSNYPEYTYMRTQDALDFSRHMDGCIWSYQHKTIKPEAKIYQILIDTYHIDPKKSLFLDDKQENLDAAKKFGMKTILFTDYETVEKKLKMAGILS